MRNQGKAFPRRRGFTLVELLVVIGIIALLISILLPSLNKARRAAKAVQCSSNMKQIAVAMLAYANSNKGSLPPAQVTAGGTILPEGWWWATELVAQRYVNAPNLYRDGDPAKPELNTRSTFYCPEGRFETKLNDDGGKYPRWPTDEHNFQYGEGPAKTIENGKKLSIASWYMVPGRPITGTNQLPTGRECTPFVWYNQNAATTDQNLRDPGYDRKLSMVRKPAELVMLVESFTINFVDQNNPNSFTPPHRARRLGGRHGAKTDSGTNAWTNIAFFDGHVATFPTEKFDRAKASASGENDTGFRNWTQEAIFYLNQQKGQSTNAK